MVKDGGSEVPHGFWLRVGGVEIVAQVGGCSGSAVSFAHTSDGRVWIPPGLDEPGPGGQEKQSRVIPEEWDPGWRPSKIMIRIAVNIEVMGRQLISLQFISPSGIGAWFFIIQDFSLLLIFVSKFNNFLQRGLAQFLVDLFLDMAWGVFVFVMNGNFNYILELIT